MCTLFSTCGQPLQPHACCAPHATRVTASQRCCMCAAGLCLHGCPSSAHTAAAEAAAARFRRSPQPCHPCSACARALVPPHPGHFCGGHPSADAHEHCAGSANAGAAVAGGRVRACRTCGCVCMRARVPVCACMCVLMCASTHACAMRDTRDGIQACTRECRGTRSSGATDINAMCLMACVLLCLHPAQTPAARWKLAAAVHRWAVMEPR